MIPLSLGEIAAAVGGTVEGSDDSEAEHRAVGEYAASRADLVVTVGEAARPIADGAGERAVPLATWCSSRPAARRASTRSPPRSRSFAGRRYLVQRDGLRPGDKVSELEQMPARARQFVGDVSHELRSPLPGMTGRGRHLP